MLLIDGSRAPLAKWRPNEKLASAFKPAPRPSLDAVPLAQTSTGHLSGQQRPVESSSARLFAHFCHFYHFGPLLGGRETASLQPKLVV